MWNSIKRRFRAGGTLHHLWDADSARTAAKAKARKAANAKEAPTPKGARKPAAARKQTPRPSRGSQPVTPRRRPLRPTGRQGGGLIDVDRPATVKQVAYLRKLAHDAGETAPIPAELTAAAASAWIEHLGGRKLEARREARRDRLQADRAQAVAARHAQGLTGHWAGGGAEALAESIRDLRAQYAAAEASGDHDWCSVLRAKLERADDERMRARQNLYDDRYILEKDLERLREGSHEWAEAIDDLAAVEDQLAILSVHAGG